MKELQCVYRGVVFAALCVFALAGCQTAPKGDFVHKTEAELAAMEKLNIQANNCFSLGNYKGAETLLKKLTAERTVSRPLYQLELLSVLLLDSRLQEAHELMVKLHNDLETLFDKKSEEKAQSVWHGEINKVFKGDSYERSTFYALMALSYIRKGEYEDALRCVKNGLLADADSTNENAIADYGLLYYLGYFAASKMKDQAGAEEYFKALSASLVSRGFKSEGSDGKQAEADCFKQLKEAGHNVLVVVWTGMPPTVECVGEYKEKRIIIRGRNPFDFLTLAQGIYSPFILPNNLGDLDFQATTRGGRLMDNVLADKAAVKKAMEVSRNLFFVAGTGLLLAGARTMGSLPVGLSLMGAGLGCYVIGGTVHIVGSMMNPAADARFWRNIPCQLYIVPLKLPEGKHTVVLNGYHKFDLAGMGIYDLDVRKDVPVNVFHLPMLTQGRAIWNATQNKIRSEINTAVQKANLNPMAKEL